MIRGGSIGLKFKTRSFPAGNAKVGATAGWVVNAANNQLFATLAASQTNSTIVVGVQFPAGSVLKRFSVVGQIASAGNAGTVSANLRVLTSNSSGNTDASVDSITPLTATSNTEINATNATKTLTPRTVAANEIYYILITGTTGVSVTVSLMGVQFDLDEA